MPFSRNHTRVHAAAAIDTAIATHVQVHND
jgi:hypothetical protein